MSIKKSLMISDSTLDYINARTKADTSDVRWSHEVNKAFSQLGWTMRQALPDLTHGEWELLLNVYAGTWLDDFAPPFRIASDIMDHFGAVDLSTLDEDTQAVIRRMHGLSQVEQLAVMDFIQKYWSNDWSHCKDFDHVIDEVKALGG